MNRRTFLTGTLLLSCARKRAGSPIVLHGSGATLPFPLYSRWSSRYSELFPDVRINYQPLGSGAGFRQIHDRVVDFGASEEPIGEAQRGDFLHVPATVGAVVIACNVAPAGALSLTPELTADIFLGDINRWDDRRLLAANPGVPLPAAPIQVVHRADGSGTSASLATFLSKRSGRFRERIGGGKSPRFPVGIGARGSFGMTALVKTTPGAVGYVERTYAAAAGLTVARMDGLSPTFETMTRALVDGDDALGYPLTALSFVLVPRVQRDAVRGAALARFLWWAIHEGQGLAASEGFAALPERLVARAEEAVSAMRADGRPLLGGA